ncbi:MAG TPA: hypothetical protein VHW09_21100 [Bryobacteraceae bacterium]|jgi:hypothetical protein|nr:hypothetical protein [Bryobacteraceae bacterium]
MDAAPGAERLAIARSEVNRACGLLIASTPEALQNCQKALRTALSELTAFRSTAGEGPAAAGARKVTAALQSDVQLAGSLLRNLANFYKGWERIQGIVGYTANGDPSAVARRGRICCRG